MRLYEQGKLELAKDKKVKFRRLEYSTRILTFDTETTSYKLGEDDYRATLYLWQACNGDKALTVYGRDYQSMDAYFREVSSLNGDKWQIIYIHNLGFDFEFIRNLGYKWDVFARTAHKPIYCRCEELKLELRDSLTYFHKSLEKLGQDLKLEVQKEKGYNYELIRHSLTPLTTDELRYGDGDVITLFLALEKELAVYKHICKLPYTQTGKVRRVVMKQVLYKQRYDTSFLVPHSRGFYLLQKAFLGGYTHANYKYAGDILTDVDSDDFASSYPAVMVSEKYPSSKFFKVTSFKKDHCHLINVVLHNIKSIVDLPYLPSYSALTLEGEELDNGKVWSAKTAQYIMTDVDFNVVKACYNIESYELIEIYASRAKYLPKPFVEFILESYGGKTMLKGVKGAELEYAIKKEQTNSLYGMAVTNNVRDEVTFEEYWGRHNLTLEEIDEKLDKMRESGKERLAYQWGVWVTAYARRNLFYAIWETKGNCIAYVDTDSLKTYFESESERESFRELIARINARQVAKIDNALKAQGIDPELSRPRNAQGVACQLGVFDYEGRYTYFRTWGAKKYAYEKDGEQGITVSGLNKRKAIKDPKYKGVKDFVIGKTWDEQYSGRTVSTYCEDMSDYELTDYLGNKCVVSDRFGVNIEKTTYTLGLTDEYYNFISYELEDDVKTSERVSLWS